MSMLIEDKYTLIEEIEEQLKDCCAEDIPSDPSSSDCCYEDWKKKLREVKAEFEQVCEEARLAEEELKAVTNRRDRLYKWLQELEVADEMAHMACNQIGQLINQLEDLNDSTKWSTEAIRILYCMLKDFYLQIDEIKVKYDYIINCIKCLDHPVFESDKGLLKCLDDYYLALDEVIKTRDSLLKNILKAISLVNQLFMNVGDDYGLRQILGYWKSIFNCAEVHDHEDKDDEVLQKRPKQQHPRPDDKDRCEISPKLSLPICEDDYYEKLEKLYKEDKDKVKILTRRLARKTKKKEKLQACKKSLEDAMKEVDPKNRCNT